MNKEDEKIVRDILISGRLNDGTITPGDIRFCEKMKTQFPSKFEELVKEANSKSSKT